MYVVRQRRGLGAYPTDCFYDANRPSWLPYFIDTPTESQAKIACFYGAGGGVTAQQILNPNVAYPPPPAPAVPAAPTGTAVPSTPSDAMLPGTLADQAAAATQAQNQQFFNDLAQSLNPSLNPSGSNLSLGAMLAIGLVAGVGLLLVTSGSRRRR
jgi:hypothetical protein